MQSWKSEPYLWVHLAGLAAVPIFAQLVWLGFSLGTPLAFYRLELAFVALIGIVPIFLMQWQKPFNIFSLLVLCLKPEVLTQTQQKILSLFKSNTHRSLSIFAAFLLLVLMIQIYPLAPIASGFTSFLPQYRLLGLLIAALAFLATNLFVQVPISVLGVLLTNSQKLEATQPYPLEKISQDFTNIGIPVRKILPVLTSTEATPQDTIPPKESPETPTQSTQT